MGPMSPVLKQGEGIKEGGLWVCCGDKAPLSQLPFSATKGCFLIQCLPRETAQPSRPSPAKFTSRNKLLKRKKYRSGWERSVQEPCRAGPSLAGRGAQQPGWGGTEGRAALLGAGGGVGWEGGGAQHSKQPGKAGGPTWQTQGSCLS